MSSNGKQITIMHILLNILRNIGNQTMKFGNLKKNNVKNIIHQKSCRKLSRRTCSRPLFVLLKNLYLRLKQVASKLVPLLYKIQGNICIAIIFFKVYDVKNFKVKHNFLINFSYMITIVRKKIKYLNNEKRCNKKHFPLLLKSFQLLEIVSDPGLRLR